MAKKKKYEVRVKVNIDGVIYNKGDKVSLEKTEENIKKYSGIINFNSLKSDK